jgi:teichoic acid transport system permease protein
LEQTPNRRLRVYDADHKLPPLRPYLLDTFTHLRFAHEKAKLDLRASHKDTWFGRIWNVLNPLLLALIYWLLIVVIFGSGGSIFDLAALRVLAQIVAGLFLFSLPSAALSLGARSIIGGGSFILNTRLPRMILPIAAVDSALLTLWPSLAVYLLFHTAAEFPFSLQMLWVFPIVAMLTIISIGLSMITATLTVFFRDVASFLPYILRIWMYLTPVIFTYDRIPKSLQWGIYLNPFGGIFSIWQQVLFEARTPDTRFLATALLWTFLTPVVGILFFLRREREFAVRI